MKTSTFLRILLLTMPGVAVGLNLRNSKPTKGSRPGQANSSPQLFQSNEDTHRQLKGRDGKKGQGKKGENNGGEFVCPENSIPIPYLDDYSSIDDCECEKGYTKQGNKCMAQQGLCTIENIEKMEAKQEEVDGWMEMAGKAADYDEAESCADKMNQALTVVWDDYHAILASCDQFGEVGGPDRNLRFGRRIRRALRKTKKVFQELPERVVKVATIVADKVVDVVAQIKCGLVKAFFTVAGLALDFAFIVATGGSAALLKGANVLCLASGLGSLIPPVQADALDDDKGNLRDQLIEAIANPICAVSRKVDSEVLDAFCEVDQAGNVALNLLDNPLVARFISLIEAAICGSPGTFLAIILEDAVDCEIGCGEQGNIICGEL